MSYVSVRYTVDPTGMQAKSGERPVIATDDQGREWHLAENSEVGDWLRFVEAGGEIEAYEDPAQDKKKRRK